MLLCRKLLTYPCEIQQTLSTSTCNSVQDAQWLPRMAGPLGQRCRSPQAVLQNVELSSIIQVCGVPRQLHQLAKGLALGYSPHDVKALQVKPPEANSAQRAIGVGSNPLQVLKT